jgi:DNA-binding NarL/FixJ family response regulator
MTRKTGCQPSAEKPKIEIVKSEKVKILIVDDHPVVREGLAMRIATQPDLEICGEAEDMPGALGLLDSCRPDVAIIDISLKNGNGIDLIRRIRARHSAAELPILVWSMYPENLYAERALRAGAQGYLHKGQATRQLVDAIRAVLAGKVYIGGELADELLHRVVGGVSMERSPLDRLSDRELETFELMGNGLTTEAIAAKMHVSPKTVETYRARIKEKLCVNNVTELVQRAAHWVLEGKRGDV